MSTVDFDISGLKKANDYLMRLSAKTNQQKLLSIVGALHESQVRRRISKEKTAPDGSAWQEWSTQYAKTRHGGHSLLQGKGDLLDSILYQQNKTSVRIGSPLPYAKTMQDGFNGKVKVGSHIRRISQAFGRALPFPVFTSVGAFTRNMDIQAREFLGLSSQNETEMQEDIFDFYRGLI